MDFRQRFKNLQLRPVRPTQNLFGGLSVVELDPATFQMLGAYRFCGKVSESQKVWVWRSCVRDFADGTITRYERSPSHVTARALGPATYFNREVRQASQMSLGR